MKTVRALALAVLPVSAIASTADPVPRNSNDRAGIAAVVAGRAITLQEVDAAVGSRLLAIRAQEYSLRREALDRLIETVVLEEEARRRGVTVEALLAAEVAGKVRPVQAEEVQAVYDGARDRFSGVAEEEAHRRIREGMERRRREQRRAELVPALTRQLKAEVLLLPLRTEVSADDDPSLGPAQAPVTIVEFSDFECPYCARAVPVVHKIRERYTDKVRVVFRDFPLSMHKKAALAAEAATCAQQQDRFWPLHDRLFAMQSKLELESIKEAAAAVGLEPRAFEECLKSGRAAAEWRKDVEDARSYGVSGTPTFFVNGRMVTGGATVENLSRVIDEELARVASASKGR
jgi:protein-disulfide isomerase